MCFNSNKSTQQLNYCLICVFCDPFFFSVLFAARNAGSSVNFCISNMTLSSHPRVHSNFHELTLEASFESSPPRTQTSLGVVWCEFGNEFSFGNMSSGTVPDPFKGGSILFSTTTGPLLIGLGLTFRGLNVCWPAALYEDTLALLVSSSLSSSAGSMLSIRFLNCRSETTESCMFHFVTA